jgi:hypothetical protein
VTSQAARAKPRTAIGSLAPRRSGEIIAVLLFVVPSGIDPGLGPGCGSLRLVRRASSGVPLPDIFVYDLRAETGPRLVLELLRFFCGMHGLARRCVKKATSDVARRHSELFRTGHLLKVRPRWHRPIRVS